MLVRANDVDTQTVRSDLCIIGAGAAGLTVAHTLRRSGFDICLLESGDLTYAPDIQQLYGGAADGTVLPPNSPYLSQSRLRYFGGSTNHWAGYCRPLDDLDFRTRPWVPNSGWPYRKATLSKYYDGAAAIVQIPSFDEGEDAQRQHTEPLVRDSDAFVTKQFHMSPPTRFAERYGQALADASDVSVYLGANVVCIEANEAGTRIDRVRVATLSGRRFDVESRRYVLATGGIENARLLLISDGVHRAGLGNDRDLVGRYFMEHPHVRNAGAVVMPRGLADRAAYSRRGPRRAVICPSEALQRKHRLLNSSIMLEFDMPPPPPAVRHVANMLRDLDTLGRNQRRDIGSAWSGCFVRAEQSPNRESRVTLASERDAMGIRRSRLEWKMTPADIESIRRTMELLGIELGSSGRGRARQGIQALSPWEGVEGGDHHMGTTRMSDSPTEGVVNSDCQVHGVANLYVAGSSVFPTAGFANPTLTIVALAVKLADHLRDELRDG